MVPKIAGITRTLKIAKEEGITNILLVTDNIASITITTLAKQSSINSRLLKKYMSYE